ncbi:hypothetical protein AVDCRST_MAG94-1335, partial [uncultured Leptolyngbya sp.]
MAAQNLLMERSVQAATFIHVAPETRKFG